MRFLNFNFYLWIMMIFLIFIPPHNEMVGLGKFSTLTQLSWDFFSSISKECDIIWVHESQKEPQHLSFQKHKSFPMSNWPMTWQALWQLWKFRSQMEVNEVLLEDINLMIVIIFCSRLMFVLKSCGHYHHKPEHQKMLSLQ